MCSTIDDARIRGLDTETYRGKAILIGTARFYVEPRSWDDAACAIRSWGRLFVAWNVAYDAQALLRWLTRPILSDLALRGTVKFPARSAPGETWTVRYVPRKRIEFKRSDWQTGVAIRDAMVWYASGLDAAAAKWLGKRKLPIPRAWLEDARKPLKRGGRARRRFIAYCRRDAALAASLHRRVRRGFAALGVDVSRVASPAGAAGRRWKESLRVALPDDAQRAFQEGYYGGRFETLTLGRARGLDVYDLRSAYPWAYSTLPTLRGAMVREIAADEDLRAVASETPYAVFRVTVDVPLTSYVGPLPVRAPDGLVLFPVGSWSASYTLPEIRAALDFGVRVKVHGGVAMIPVCDDPAFPDVEALFLQRLNAEAAGDADTSLAVKLLLNGLYGKTAEQRTAVREVRSIGGLSRTSGEIRSSRDGLFAAVEFPAASACFAYAATATALVRVRLLRELPWGSVAFVATDSAALRHGAKPSGRLGGALGDWKPEASNLRGVILGNGVYFLDGRGKSYARTRGVHRFSADDMDDRLSSLADDETTVPLPSSLRGTSLAQAARGDFDGFNLLELEGRELRLDADRKRYWHGSRTARDFRTRAIRSGPMLWLDETTFDVSTLIRRPFR